MLCNPPLTFGQLPSTVGAPFPGHPRQSPFPGHNGQGLQLTSALRKCDISQNSKSRCVLEINKQNHKQNLNDLLKQNNGNMFFKTLSIGTFRAILGNVVCQIWQFCGPIPYKIHERETLLGHSVSNHPLFKKVVARPTPKIPKIFVCVDSHEKSISWKFQRNSFNFDRFQILWNFANRWQNGILAFLSSLRAHFSANTYPTTL